MIRYQNKPRRPKFKPVAKAIPGRMRKWRQMRIDGAYATLLMLLAVAAAARLCAGTPLSH